MNNKRYVFLIFFPLHIISVLGLILTSFSWSNIFYFFIGYTLLYGLGVNVGLHRYYSHKSIDIKENYKPLIHLLSILSAQGHPIWWAALHRGVHHKYADTDLDEHTPNKGYWRSLAGWILSHNPKKVNYKFSVDLLRDKRLVLTQKYYEIIIYTFWVLAFLIDFNLAIWAFIIPSLVGLYAEGLVNTICHSHIGYRNFETKDQSKNNLILGYLTWGNGWHNNHHYYSGSFNFGSGISGKSYEFDPSMIFYKFLSK